MANQTGIAITINAFLPTGKTLDQQFEALSLVKTAHASGNYAALIASSIDVLVKTEQKTRRIPDAVPAPVPAEVQEIFDQAKFDADYQRGFEAGKAHDLGTPFDANPDGFAYGWTEGNKAAFAEEAAMNTIPAPVNTPELVDQAALDEEDGFEAGLADKVITEEQAKNDSFMTGYSNGAHARPKTKKPKAA